MDEMTEEKGARWPNVWIVLASLAAHVWCLGSVFYMDDTLQILDSDKLRWSAVMDTPLLAWTQGGYVLQKTLFGLSPVGFHVVNLLLHTGVACALYGLGVELLGGGWRRVVWFAALLFAVHPLGSEIPNYVRTQDLAWVTLFSLLAARWTVKYLRGGRWVDLAWVVVFALGATISKGPGGFHVLMMCGAVALVVWRGKESVMPRKTVMWLGGAGLVLLVLWIANRLLHAKELVPHWGEPRLIGHAYTLARVFWEFAWRAVVPVKLCSDHLITETMMQPGDGWLGVMDRVANVSMAGLLGLCVAGLVMAWRARTMPWRVVGVCVAVFTGTMIFRFAYLIPEFMPEYRIYPGLPWFCLGLAVVLGRMFSGATVAPWIAGLWIAGFASLSAKRSFVWHDLGRLTDDVLAQYPANARAIWVMDNWDMREGRWEDIIRRQQERWPGVYRAFIEGNQKLAPVREIPTGHFALAEVACTGRMAIALAHTGRAPLGLAVLDQLESKMHALKMDPDAHRIHWNHYRHARAVVFEQSGRYAEALELMRDEKNIALIREHDIRRVEAKAKAEEEKVRSEK